MKNKTMLASIVILAVSLILVHVFVSRTLQFKEEALIQKPIDEVWEILGNQFTEPHLWATNFIASKPGGTPKLPGLSYRHRATLTESGDNWQELDAFDPANYSLTYHISKGVPPIAKSAIGTWKLVKISETQTQLDVDFSLTTKGLLGFVMSPIVGKKVGKASAEIVEEFKYYLENEQPHPRKLAAVKD
ncbi:MAG: hypothetical protein F6K19_02820 [Cyanothece sp. SIO1E1]|nr:hypothetical protein [Cyanothece sp. SIO1E1]